jgi:hypothetical protein
MKDNDWYSGRDPEYPNKPAKPIMPKRNADSETFQKYAEDLAVYEKKKSVWNREYFNYRVKLGERQLQIELDLKEELFDSSWMTDATWNLVYQKAYDDAHSGGYDEVRWKVEELVEFSQKVHESAKYNAAIG